MVEGMESPPFSEETLARVDAICPPLPAGGRVGIFGGSFNPPHLAHALLALSTLATESLDGLWILPCADHPFGKDLESLTHRAAMCRLAFGRVAGPVEVVELEKHLPSPNYTATTLQVLHRVRPGIAPIFLMGSDLLADWHQWHAPEIICRLSEVVVVPRQGFAAAGGALPDSAFRWHRGFALPNLASAELRTRLAHADQDGDIAGLLDRDVLAYIRQHELYKNRGA
jgi:nicotinate-nucleotide adenylyltransferase